MREYGKALTPEQVAAVLHPSQPWTEPTEILPVPTPEEMALWLPDEAPEKLRYRMEHNVTTGETKIIELTLEEYRARHVAKIIGKNEYLLRKRADAKAAERKALWDRLVDK